jgi:beta-glucosidase
VNPRTVVVLNSGNPVLMTSWIDKVKAVVQAWYPGQEGGFAVADILTGKINPSGKLPVSILRRWEDSPDFQNYPGKNETLNYSEGIFVGYRYFDTFKTAPLFPFGHGLSYTKFDYSDLKIDLSDLNSPLVDVSFKLTNIGSRAGAEVAQIYIHDNHPDLSRPEQELKGFTRVTLAPGESTVIHQRLDDSAFAYYDVATHTWKVPSPGNFNVRVGGSSRDIRLQQDIRLEAPKVF